MMHLMEAMKFCDDYHDVAGWLWSEKYDGLRGYWDGKQFLSSNGNLYNAPGWFRDLLPRCQLDGELWAGRGKFQECSSIVRSHDSGDRWRQIRFMVFDMPLESGPFAARLAVARRIIAKADCQWMHAVEHNRIASNDAARQTMKAIVAKGGEGVILREPASPYEQGCKPSHFLKLKPLRYAWVIVKGLAHGPRGKPILLCDWEGRRIKVSNGLPQSGCLPSVGTKILFSYQNVTNSGMPRFPVYVRG